MNINLLKQGVLTVNDQGIGEVSDDMLRKRGVELAMINGRAGEEPTKDDEEQARRELTGGSELDPQESILESVPESERWDTLPGSTGHRAPTITSDAEDSEGRSDSEALVEEGVREAEHDQMLQAARAQQQEDDA